MECKYAEDLKASLRAPAAGKYVSATTTPPWSEGAGEILDQTGLRQFWYNQLLTQVVASYGRYVEGFGVVVACSADRATRDAVSAVRATLVHQDDCDVSDGETIRGVWPLMVPPERRRAMACSASREYVPGNLAAAGCQHMVAGRQSCRL